MAPPSDDEAKVQPATPLAGAPDRRADRAQPHARTVDWGRVLRDALVAGALGGVLSAAALAWRGRLDAGSAVAPVNAVSHVLWDREAFRVRQPTVRHTLPGYLIHHASATAWAALLAWWQARHPPATPAHALAGAAATAALACAVDYTVTPPRLQPGFEQHLSTRSMVWVYAALALGLAAGSLLAAHGIGERTGAPGA